MDTALSLAALAAKLNTVTSVGTGITVIGALACVAGWLWLVYQNGRFNVVHGVLSLLIPPYALVFAFVGLEHRQKSAWTTVFLAGAVIAGVGYALLFAANDCEMNPDCGRRLETIEEVEAAPAEPDESSVRSATDSSDPLAYCIQ